MKKAPKPNQMEKLNYSFYISFIKHTVKKI